MLTTLDDVSAQTELTEYDKALAEFSIKNYTSAKLQMQGEFVINTNAESLFELVTDPQLIASWFGMIKGGFTDHTLSNNNNEWGEGSKRICYSNMGTLNETIYFWRAPYIAAYNVQSWSMPVKDHCSVMIIQPLGSERCKLTWRHYFNYKGVIMKNFFPYMMIKLMNKGLMEITNKFGGAGGVMKLAK